MVLKKAFILLLSSSCLFLIPAFGKSFSLHSLLNIKTRACDTLPVKDSVNDHIFEKVETEASFPGGESAWKDFLAQTLDPTVPVKRKAPKGAYTVWIQFVVDKKGNLSDFKALTDQGYGMEKEVIRTLKKSPPWTPAYLNGKTVKVYRKQPITFVVKGK
jgi:protein TonB